MRDHIIPLCLAELCLAGVSGGKPPDMPSRAEILFACKKIGGRRGYPKGSDNNGLKDNERDK